MIHLHHHPLLASLPEPALRSLDANLLEDTGLRAADVRGEIGQRSRRP